MAKNGSLENLIVKEKKLSEIGNFFVDILSDLKQLYKGSYNCSSCEYDIEHTYGRVENINGFSFYYDDDGHQGQRPYNVYYGTRCVLSFSKEYKGKVEVYKYEKGAWQTKLNEMMINRQKTVQDFLAAKAGGKQPIPTPTDEPTISRIISKEQKLSKIIGFIEKVVTQTDNLTSEGHDYEDGVPMRNTWWGSIDLKGFNFSYSGDSAEKSEVKITYGKDYVLELSYRRNFKKSGNSYESVYSDFEVTKYDSGDWEEKIDELMAKQESLISAIKNKKKIEEQKAQAVADKEKKLREIKNRANGLGAYLQA